MLRSAPCPSAPCPSAPCPSVWSPGVRCRLACCRGAPRHVVGVAVRLLHRGEIGAIGPLALVAGAGTAGAVIVADRPRRGDGGAQVGDGGAPPALLRRGQS